MKEKSGLTTEAGKAQDNVKKNRYKDILPYDQTRVCLSPTLPEYSSDYINANFIKGVNGNRAYIATQGPLSNTVVDYWRMIWQYDVKVIIMACREFELGKKKCEVYWASNTESSTFGPFIITTVDETFQNKEVIVRALAVRYCDETRVVSQFQYMAWPDHGIPDTADSILEMMKLAHVKQDNHPGPMLIHCSAGCGRTGVICAIDYVNDLLNEKKIREDFNIMDIILELRRQRPAAVQTKEQYVFVFHTVAQIFEKVLKMPSDTTQNRNKESQSFYINAAPPKPALRLHSTGGSGNDHKTRNPPSLHPRPSYPPPSRTMNDTYAVVNKTKNPTPQPLHQYDNENLPNLKKTTDDLYSIVKPKNRPAGNRPVSAMPVYARPVPSRESGSSGINLGGYESLSDFRPRDSQLHPQCTQESTDQNSSTDDDYEYVSGPVIKSTGNSISNSSSNISSYSSSYSSSNSSSYCSPNGIGFNCRVKKPKGPREPPSQWNCPER
ncbi:tyrosine-protein phosphatase non-receptor type 18 [Trichomycterus rosablanca]|uniref:tyrosine-protein phosphatase non-receptor type 18 n=1 Tax=Trichomycterus rosablanca TaxID=2290929 RepID=UPI002F359A59